MLNDQQIIEACEENELITPLNFKLLQPHSYDATLSNTIKFARYDAASHRRYWDCYDISDPNNCLVSLNPGEFALASTHEYFRLPQHIVGFVQGKSSIGRNGLQIENAGLIDAGFSGAITLELYNMAPWPITLKPGMAICQIHFTLVDSPVYKDYSKTGHYNKQQGPTEAVYTL